MGFFTHYPAWNPCLPLTAYLLYLQFKSHLDLFSWNKEEITPHHCIFHLFPSIVLGIQSSHILGSHLKTPNLITFVTENWKWQIWAHNIILKLLEDYLHAPHPPPPNSCRHKVSVAYRIDWDLGVLSLNPHYAMEFFWITLGQLYTLSQTTSQGCCENKMEENDITCFGSPLGKKEKYK